MPGPRPEPGGCAARGSFLPGDGAWSDHRLGWAIGGWHGALTALLWAGPVRVTLLQHVTWSVNSLCHVIGGRPFATRRYDRATNLWPLALLSLGESWHNMHHSDPTCARHGADPWQIDISATVIGIFERLGWATGVRWPILARLDDRRRSPMAEHRLPHRTTSHGTSGPGDGAPELWLVSPPRPKIGAPWARQIATARSTSWMFLGMTTPIGG